MIYSILPALGPAGWAIGGVLAGAAIVKALDSDSDQHTVAVVQERVDVEPRRRRKHKRKRLRAIKARLEAMERQNSDLIALVREKTTDGDA